MPENQKTRYPQNGMHMHTILRTLTRPDKKKPLPGFRAKSLRLVKYNPFFEFPSFSSFCGLNPFYLTFVEIFIVRDCVKHLENVSKFFWAFVFLELFNFLEQFFHKLLPILR